MFSEAGIGPGAGASVSGTVNEVRNSTEIKRVMLKMQAFSNFSVQTPEEVDSIQRGIASPTWQTTRCGTWLSGSPAYSIFGAFLAPNASQFSCSYMNYGFYAARSYHSGGVNALMADGSVRFVGDTVDLDVWRAAATVAGSESESL